MQNSSNDRDFSKQNLREALEQVEVSDRLSPQPKCSRTHSVKTPTDINAESLSAQISEDLTTMQVASHLLEAGNDNTVCQILPSSSQGSPSSIVSVDRVSLWPQKPGVVKQIESSSEPTQTVETASLTSNSIAQFYLKDNSKNLNADGVAVVQNPDNSIIVQYPDSTIHNLTDGTIAQYSDSAIHNPAERTVCQAVLPLSTEPDQTIYQRGIPKSSPSSTLAIAPKNRTSVQLFHPSIFRDMFRASGSFTSRFINSTEQFFYSIWRKIDLKQLQSCFHRGRQLTVVKTLEQSTLSCINRSTPNAMDSEEQPSLEQYQKKLRELDFCRLSFAKELARNGKFRNAIAMAEQISEASYLFKDSQQLIQSWK